MQWKSKQISDLLYTNAKFNRLGDEEAEADASDCKLDLKLGIEDVAFALFLEPPQETSPYSTMSERVVDALIQAFSQKPTMVHCELIMPPFRPSQRKVHFATYLGAQAGYQNETDVVSGVDFYLIKHGRRWRAVPIFGRDVNEKMRATCDANVGSPYSILMYPTSSHYFRSLSWVWKDKDRHKGHCATITARVVRNSETDCRLAHQPPWYSPSSLYGEMHDALGKGMDEASISSLHSDVNEQECNADIETILRGPLAAKSFFELGHERCVTAIRELAYRSVTLARDDATFDVRRESERELADALLKWCLVGRAVVEPPTEETT